MKTAVVILVFIIKWCIVAKALPGIIHRKYKYWKIERERINEILKPYQPGSAITFSRYSENICELSDGTEFIRSVVNDGYKQGKTIIDPNPGGIILTVEDLKKENRFFKELEKR